MQNKKPQMIIYKSFEVFRQYPEPGSNRHDIAVIGV